MTAHVHEWGHPPANGPTPLLCLGCGELWPGAPLPKSPNSHESAGLHDPDFVPWHTRVDRMLSELAKAG